MNVEEVAALPIADKAAILIREYEGFTDTAMWDVNAYRIGNSPDQVLLRETAVGHGSDTITFEDGTYRSVKKGDKTTRANALKDLTRRVNKEFLPRLRKQLGDDTYNRLPWPAVMALTSLSYNYGSITKPSIITAARTLNMPLLADVVVKATYDDNKALPESMRAALRKRRAQEAEYIRMAQPSKGGNNGNGSTTQAGFELFGLPWWVVLGVAVGVSVSSGDEKDK